MFVCGQHRERNPALRGPDLFSFWSMVTSLIYFEAYRSLMEAKFCTSGQRGRELHQLDISYLSSSLTIFCLVMPI